MALIEVPREGAAEVAEPFAVDVEALGQASFARTVNDLGPMERAHARRWKADTWHGAGPAGTYPAGEGTSEATREWHRNEGRRCLEIVNDAIAIEVMNS